MFAVMLLPLSGMTFSPALPTYILQSPIHLPLRGSIPNALCLLPLLYLKLTPIISLTLLDGSDLFSRLPYLAVSLFVILVIFYPGILVCRGDKKKCLLD